MDKKEKVETTEEATKKKEVEEKTFTQADVNNIVAKNVKEEMNKVLEKLEVEDFDNAKEAINEFKKHQDAQKSELEKVQETNAKLNEDLQKWRTMYQEKDLEIGISNTLKELEVDTKHAEVLKKLIDSNEVLTEDGINKEVLKKQLENVIEEKLPMLKEVQKAKVGVENKDKTPNTSGHKSFLDEKYKNNPFYKG